MAASRTDRSDRSQREARKSATGSSRPFITTGSELLEAHVTHRVVELGSSGFRQQHLARPGDVDDPGGDVHVMADEVAAPDRLMAPVQTDPHPQRKAGRVGVGIEPRKQIERGAQRRGRIREPQQQAVAELLDQSRAARQRGDDELLLPRQELTASASPRTAVNSVKPTRSVNITVPSTTCCTVVVAVIAIER